jgi:hypothetical protein
MRLIEARRTMQTAGTTKAMARRVAAVRAELSELQARTDPAGRAMAKAVRRDLAVLESRLHDAIREAV